MSYSKEEMARLAASEIVPGTVVNLGIGLPTLVANYLPERSGVWLHTENGILGMGPFPEEGSEDPQIINAGKQTVTVVPGGSCFDSSRSFAMIRGGHVDLAILGAMQVAPNGDLANWAIPEGRTMGIGGAMDLAAGARRIVVLTRHRTKTGDAKLVERCTYPLTATGVVGRVITDLGVLDVVEDSFRLVACAPGVTPEQVVRATGGSVEVAME